MISDGVALAQHRVWTLICASALGPTRAHLRKPLRIYVLTRSDVRLDKCRLTRSHLTQLVLLHGDEPVHSGLDN